jgi:hypothetical protein
MATLTITDQIVNLLRSRPNKPLKVAEIADLIAADTPQKTVGSMLQQLIRYPERGHGVIRTGYGMYAFRPTPIPAPPPSAPADPPVIHSIDAVSAYPAELVMEQEKRHPMCELFGMTMDGTRLIRDEWGTLYYLGEPVK